MLILLKNIIIIIFICLYSETLLIVWGFMDGSVLYYIISVLYYLTDESSFLAASIKNMNLHKHP